MFKRFFSLGINRLFIFIVVFIQLPFSFWVYQKDIEQELPFDADVMRHSSSKLLEMISSKQVTLGSQVLSAKHHGLPIAVRTRNNRYEWMNIDTSLSKSSGVTPESVRDEFLSAYQKARDEVRRDFTIGFLSGSLLFSFVLFLVFHGIRWVFLGFFPRK